MNSKLFKQIMKFAVVGGLSFVIDFVITLVVSSVCRKFFAMSVENAALVGGIFGVVYFFSFAVCPLTLVTGF